MSNAAKDTSANDDVLASIRRLVAEESSRGQSAPAPSAPETTQVEPAPKPQVDPPRQGRVLQRRRAPDSGTVVDRQSINRAARAKLLLTDDFRVEDMERWVDEADAFDLPPEPELEPELDPEFDPTPAPEAEAAPEPTVHGRGVYDDEDQAQISRDIESFLNAPEPKGQAEPVAEIEAVAEDAPDEEDAPLQEMSFEDIPDAVFSASQDRAARRREASERATSETSRASAALRAPMDAEPVADVEDVAEQAPTPAPAAKTVAVPEPEAVVPEAAMPVAADTVPTPAPHAVVPAATVDQIEAAVQASLAAFAEQGDLAGPAESELVLDEEMLREMVSEIVRRELQGSLGERITRNVRKLVRREIYRALETRDLG